MKKYFCLFLAFLLALTAGCAEKQTDAANGKRKVYASFYPMYDFARKAAGELAEVVCLVPDGMEPHDWEPSPQDIAGLAGADLFVYSGAGFESWVPSVLPNIKSDTLTPVDTSANVAEIEQSADPHIWLDPKIAKRQFEAICDALAEKDPENAEIYEQNRARWCAEFDKLDSEFKELEKMPRKMIVVTHAAYGYMCGAYGIEQVAAVGFSPDAEPGPARMAEVVALAEENNVKTIFYEELEGPKTARAIANELGAEVAPLSPLEGLTDAQRNAGGDYFSVMRENLSAIKSALSD